MRRAGHVFHYLLRVLLGLGFLGLGLVLGLVLGFPYVIVLSLSVYNAGCRDG
jgi:hypothetical protein